MYHELKIVLDDRILIVAPHPDDETIGCGGILALYGSQCDVVLLTDGRLGKPENSDLSQEQTVAVRHNEFVSVMEYFHVSRYQELKIPDGKLAANSEAVSGIDLRKYDYIFVPNRNERHPDHKAAFEIVRKLYKKQNAKATLVEYEVWSPLIAPNCFLDISSVIDDKIDGLVKYESQIASIDYTAVSRGLNMYRGAPHHVAYCEAYYLSRRDHIEFKHRIKKKTLNIMKMIFHKI